MPYDRPLLIVDDDPTILQIFSEILQVVGLRVICQQDASQVLSTLEREPVDIVITDVNMPGMSGLELLKQLKAGEPKLGRSILVFVITAFSDSGKAIQALQDGAFCYLSKPVKSQALLLHLKRAVNQLSPGDGDRINIGALGPTAAAKPSPPPVRTASGSGPATPSAAGSDPTGPAPAAPLQDRPNEVLSMLHFPLDPLSVARSAPPHAGVITLRGASGEPLYLEWAEDINARLSHHASTSGAASELARRARYFEYFLSDHPTLVAKLFDKIVNETGHFPLCQNQAPEGSKYYAQPEPVGEKAARSDAVVTRYTTPKDVGLVEKVRGLLAATPDNKELLDWYAFLLYSNGMLDEAIQRYEGLVHGGSEKPDHFFYLGNAYYKKNRMVEAMEAWKIAVELAPDSKIGKKAVQRIEAVKSGQPL